MKNENTDINNQFEGLLQKIIVNEFNDELNSLLTDEEHTQEHKISPTHKKRMEKLFMQKNSPTKLQFFVKYYSRVAAVLMLLLFVGIAIVAAVPSVRSSVLNYIVKELIDPIAQTDMPVEISGLKPAYIPEGYNLAKSTSTEYILYLQYQNDNADTIEIELFSCDIEHTDPEIHSPGINTEGAVSVYPVPELQNNQQTEPKYKMVWYTNDYLGTISSALPTEEMKRIYLSLV